MRDRPLALVLGSFDVLHYGHIEFIDYAARLGDVLIGLGTDAYQLGYKHQPVLTYWERKAALERLPQVWKVVPRDQISVKQICAEHDPDYLVAGMDWYHTDGAPHLEMSGIDVDFCNRNDITLVYTPRSHSMSTSEIVRRIREGVSA